MGLFTPTLKMLSFGALPPIKVAIVDSYNRVKGDSYELLQVFRIPDSEATAAMVLGGRCVPAAADAGDDAGPSQPPQRPFHVCEGAAASGCPGGLRGGTGGGGPGARGTIAIDAKPTYIDVDYIDGALRVHKGQSGTTYVLKRLLQEAGESIPFLLDS